MENPASYKVGYRAIIKELLIPKNCGIHITKIMIIRKKRFYLANQMSFMSSINILINEGYDDLSTLYWIPKLHRNPYRERYITSPSTEALLRPSG